MVQGLDPSKALRVMVLGEPDAVPRGECAAKILTYHLVAGPTPKGSRDPTLRLHVTSRSRGSPGPRTLCLAQSRTRL